MKKNVYVALMMYSIGLTLMISLFSALAVVTNAGELGMIGWQITAFTMMLLIFVRYMKKKDSTLKKFGFVKKKVDKGTLAILIVIVLIQPLILGLRSDLSVLLVGLTILQMVLVGFTEEILFRSIFFEKLKEKSLKVYILFSAVIFAVLHAASAINPETADLLVLLQIVNAFLLGVMFALIYSQTQQIYVLAFAHAAFNILASVSKQGDLQSTLYSVLFLSISYLCGIIFLVWRNRGKELPVK